MLEWIAISSSRDLPKPGSQPMSPVASGLEGRFFTTEPFGKPQRVVDPCLKIDSTK